MEKDMIYMFTLGYMRPADIKIIDLIVFLCVIQHLLHVINSLKFSE